MLSRQANCDPSEEIGQTALWQLRQGSTLVCTALYGSDQASPRGAHVAGSPCLESCRRVGGTLVVPHAPVLSPAARGRHAICGRTQAIRSSEQAHRERGHRCWAARRAGAMAKLEAGVEVIDDNQAIYKPCHRRTRAQPWSATRLATSIFPG
jgi:hypothetical protein